MKRLTKALLLSCTFIVTIPTTGLTMENSAPWESMKLVGKGKLSFLFWDIYNASLYTATGQYNEQEYPIALQLTYLRDFKKQQLIEETEKQWQKLGFKDQQKIKQWLETLDQLWPDVKENQSITLYIDTQQRSYFYFNDTKLGQLDDPEFANAFLAIWLSEDTSAPEVRKKLISAV